MENRWFRYSAAALLSTWILFASVTGSQATTEENSTNEVDPSFVSKRQRFRVVIGETVRLPCQVDNLGPYVLLWKRGPSVLSAGSMKITLDKRINLVNGFDLEIKNARLEDEGEYVCQLSTYTPQEQTHTLEILVPPTVNAEPSHITISKGESVSLQCQGYGNPMPTITWARYNNVLLPNGEKSVANNTYKIQRADRHHAGIYVCSAFNGVGPPVSAQVDVKVQYMPDIDVERAWIHVGEGKEAILTCIVHSDPPAIKVKWYHDTMILDSDGRRLMEERGSRHSLIIRDFQRSDFGNYSCEAYNKLGRSSKQIELSGKPNRGIFRSDPVGRLSTSFNISWTFETFSPIEEYRLSYRRKYHNDTYDLPSSWRDIVLPAAAFSRGEVSSFNERNSIDRSTVTASSSEIVWKWYNIRDLDPGTIYETKVIARNKYGWGLASDLFEFSTRGVDDYPNESSAQHDVLTEPEARDMRVTLHSSASFAAISVELYLFMCTMIMVLWWR